MCCESSSWALAGSLCPPAPSVFSFPRAMGWWISIILSHHLGRAMVGASACRIYGRARTASKRSSFPSVFLLLISACSLSCKKRLMVHISHNLALLGALFFLSAADYCFLFEKVKGRLVLCQHFPSQNARRTLFLSCLLTSLLKVC